MACECFVFVAKRLAGRDQLHKYEYGQFVAESQVIQGRDKTMAGYTLGLDLGSNSIGWAIVDSEHQKLIDAGVRIFPEGVDRNQQGAEQSKNEQRRIARGMRRQISRRSRRKKTLRKALVQAGLLPEIALLPANDPRRVAWERNEFQIADPYTLRNRASKERLKPFEIGRVLLHLNQRRWDCSTRIVRMRSVWPMTYWSRCDQS